ncbi:MAG: pyruvate ferredoxin oxidoreductase, partial [Fibrobacter sp.]|nr:pyruvate ferredoxin oxidoreductase [Fibrobacter sp.]
MSTMNVKFAGLGGTGVVKASDVFAELVFELGYDVKKAEV